MSTFSQWTVDKHYWYLQCALPVSNKKAEVEKSSFKVEYSTVYGSIVWYNIVQVLLIPWGSSGCGHGRVKSDAISSRPRLLPRRTKIYKSVPAIHEHYLILIRTTVFTQQIAKLPVRNRLSINSSPCCSRSQMLTVGKRIQFDITQTKLWTGS